MKATLVKKQEGWYNLYQNDIGIGSTHEELQGYKVSLKNCQTIELGYDLDKLAREEAEKLYNKSEHEDYSVWEYLVSGEVESIKIGFQKALELMGGKKFSEDDMRKAIEIARKGSIQEQHNGYGMSTRPIFVLDNLSCDEIIDSLQQTEWDVEIEMEEEKEFIFDPTMGISQGHYLDKPKLDNDGCLILKRV